MDSLDGVKETHSSWSISGKSTVLGCSLVTEEAKRSEADGLRSFYVSLKQREKNRSRDMVVHGDAHENQFCFLEFIQQHAAPFSSGRSKVQARGPGRP